MTGARVALAYARKKLQSEYLKALDESILVSSAGDKGMKTIERDDTVHNEEYVLKSEALAEIAAAVAAERERIAKQYKGVYTCCCDAKYSGGDLAQSIRMA